MKILRKKQLGKTFIAVACIALLFSGVFLGTNYNNIFADYFSEDTNVTHATDDEELLPFNELPEQYEDNLYVELNNELVKAMNDYENGAITEQEYIKICEEIQSQIDTPEKLNNLVQEESEFIEEFGE